MKRLLALFLALGLVVMVCACSSGAEEKTETPDEETTGASAEPEEGEEVVMGTLSLLNMTEEERLEWSQGRARAVKYLVGHGVLKRTNEGEPVPEVTKIVYYDTLDDMIAALKAGEITSAEVSVSTAEYLCAHNDKLVVSGSYELEDADDSEKQVAYRLGVGYSFLTTEDNETLRDELDRAITEMANDGTLDELTQTYITDATDAKPKPVELPKTDGKTVRVAVTGALPPMDYVSADGTPAGFNTALLAELGRRLGVSFELVQVDSIGRAAALSSGQADLVFWTSCADGRSFVADKTKEELLEYIEEKKGTVAGEQSELLISLKGGLERGTIPEQDIPEGTIVTQPYYNDLTITVAMK